MSKDKESLELDKLEAEIKDIQLSVRNHKALLKLEKWKVYPTYIGVLSTLLIGAVTFALQWSQYLNQREQEQRFKVNEVMIQLVMQLDDTSSPALQRYAALELSFFGRPAVPLLLEQIDTQANQDVRDAIIKSLVEVARAEDDASEIVQSMVESTVDFVERELANQARMTVIIRHLSALADFASALSAKIDYNPKVNEGVSKKLSNLWLNIQSSTKLNAEKSKKLDDLIGKVNVYLRPFVSETD